MTELVRKDTFDLDKLLHPAGAYGHPREVVADTDLTLNEKRAILSAWASDACAVETTPYLRQQGSGPPVSFDDIMEALKVLDGEAYGRTDYGKFVNRARRIRSLYDRGENGTGSLGLS